MKQCPACGVKFECRAGNCWCDNVPISDAKRVEMRLYSDCLCPTCLDKPAVKK
ncbi:MAG: cysteine-rich CWC family protein [Terriglobales bacterium]